MSGFSDADRSGPLWAELPAREWDGVALRAYLAGMGAAALAGMGAAAALIVGTTVVAGLGLRLVLG